MNLKKKFGEVVEDTLKNGVTLSITNIITMIPDIIYVIVGIMQRITSVDFEEFTPSNNQNIFSESDKNIEYLKQLGSKNFQRFETKLLFKNLSMALNSNSEGLNAAKLFSILFEYGSKKIVNLDKPSFGGWAVK